MNLTCESPWRDIFSLHRTYLVSAFKILQALLLLEILVPNFWLNFLGKCIWFLVHILKCSLNVMMVAFAILPKGVILAAPFAWDRLIIRACVLGSR